MEDDDKTDISTATKKPANTTTEKPASTTTKKPADTITPKPVITTTQKYTATTSKNIGLTMTTEDENDIEIVPDIMDVDGGDHTQEASTTKPTLDSMALSNENQTSNSGTIAAIICSIIAILLLSALVTYCLCKCKSRAQGNSGPTGISNPLYTGPCC